MSNQPLPSLIKEALLQQGIDRYGFTPLQMPVSFEFYEEWIAAEMHGEMEYLRRHMPQKRDAQKLLAQAQSAIVVAFPYYPHPFTRGIENAKLSSARVALYAQGQDYHDWLSQKLDAVIAELRIKFPEEVFKAYVDSGPVLERDLAFRAGLGWVGKNTCLIDRKHGSLFFLGEIYTSLVLESPAALSADHCGTCTRCIDACPTQALVAPRKLDARKCISYLTIESKQLPPENLRKNLQDWLFGCDICQTVCPWNLKLHPQLKLTDLKTADQNLPDAKHSQRAGLIEDLRSLLTADDAELKRRFLGTALSRSAGFKIKRNAIVVAANSGLTELREPIARLTVDEKLSEICHWALAELQNAAKHHPE